MACIWQNFSVELWAKGGESMPTKEWKKENQKAYGISFNIKSGIPAAIEKASDEAGLKPNMYVRLAVIEKLQFDGYLSDNSVYSGPHGRIVKP